MIVIPLNQAKLHSEEFVHLRGIVVNDDNTTKFERLTVLPSSYTGVYVISISTLKLCILMFVTMGVETYSLNSHAIQIGMIFNSSYSLDNRRWIDITSQLVFQAEAEIFDGFYGKMWSVWVCTLLDVFGALAKERTATITYTNLDLKTKSLQTKSMT